MKFAGWLAQYGKGTSVELAGEDETNEDKERESNPPPEPGSNGANGSAAKVLSFESSDGTLPELTDGEPLSMVTPPGVLAEQKFTQPPPRYNEGSLVRELEKRGIGRPSTYAEIISKVQARDYVEKLPGGQMAPTELGKIVVEGLLEHEARVHGSRPSPPRWRRSSTRSKAAGSIEWSFSDASTSSSGACSTRPRKKSAGRPSPSPRTKSAPSAAPACSSAGARTGGSSVVRRTQSARSLAISEKTASPHPHPGSPTSLATSAASSWW